MGSSWRRYRTRGMGMMLLLSLGAALAGCTTENKQSVFDPHGPVAKMQLELLNMTMWFAAVIGAAVTVMLLFVVFKFRAKPGDTSEPKQVKGHHMLEVIWTVVPICILISVAVPTVNKAFSVAAPPKGEEKITVKVTAHQWWFEFEYEDYKNPTRKDTRLVTANELFIPTGKNVVLKLTSEDVIHSFWVPKLAGKMDLIPNRINTMWLKADDLGMYWGQCAEYCGSAHANMRFRVNAVSASDFDKWVATRQAGAAQPTDAVAQKGQEVWKTNCMACHSIDGVYNTSNKDQVTDGGKVGPNLSNIAGRSTIAAGVADFNEENLRKWVRNPKNFKPTEKMPNHEAMPDQDFNALIKYLMTLNK